VVGAASAQVAVSGSIAVGLQNSSSNAQARFHLTDADINFSASEDLGGGLSVAAATSISMENLRAGGGTSPLDANDHQGVTANNTSLSIAGGFGSLTYLNYLSGSAKMAPSYAEDDMTDFLGAYGTYTAFTYKTPALAGDWTVALTWAGADNDATATQYRSVDLEAKGSPYIIAEGSIGGAKIYVDNNMGNAAEGWDLRVTYDLGMATVKARTSKDKYTEFGVSMPIGAMTLDVNTGNHVGTSGTDKASGFALTYAMSKQTSLSFGYMNGKEVNSTSTNLSGSNYRLQLKKTF